MCRMWEIYSDVYKDVPNSMQNNSYMPNLSGGGIGTKVVEALKFVPISLQLY